MGRLLVLAVVAYWLLARDASAQCTSPSGESAPYGSVRLDTPAGLPTAIQDGIGDAMAAWNASGCNVGSNDFPRFTTSGNADMAVPILYNPGTSPNDVLGPRCTDINFGASRTGATASITLYGRVNLAQGTFDCFPNREVAADAVAHELGHYLGLNDSGCETHIMGGRGYTFSNGQISFETSREVQADECKAADDANSTAAERFQEGGVPAPPLPPRTEPGSPILIDLAGNGFALTALIQGVRFDLDADGWEEQTSWTSGASDDAFLVLDRNGNGWVDDGTELFGNFTPQPASESPNGYLALAELDDDGDGRITAADEVYSLLWLWNDTNHDGFSQPDEIAMLSARGIEVIHLRYFESRWRDRHGNQFRYWSLVQHTGRAPFVLSTDVFFRTRD